MGLQPGARPFTTALALTRNQLIALALAFCALGAIVCFQFYAYQTTSLAFLHIERAITVIRKTEHLVESFLTVHKKVADFARTESKESLQSADTAYSTLLDALAEFRKAVKALMLDPVRVEQIDTNVVKGGDRIRSLIRSPWNKDTGTGLRASGYPDVSDEIRTTAHALERRYLTYAVERKERLQVQRTVGLAITAVGTTLAGMVLLLATIELRRAVVQQSGLVSQITDSERQYQLLAERLQIVREEERANLAREIHDVLGQALTGIKLDISSAGRRLERSETAAALQKLKESSTAVDETIRLLRRIGSELRPPLLDQIGLASAVESYANEFSRRTSIRTTLNLIPERIPLTADQRICLFRICQESLTNVARHSGAQEAVISLSWKDDTVHLTIEDDGQGFDTQRHSGRPSLGLLGMQERARLIGAQHSIVSQPDAGTSVSVSLFVSHDRIEEVG